MRDFLNSSDVEAETDELATPRGVEAWFHARELPTTEPVTEEGRARLITVREALRALLAGRGHGGKPDGAPLATLDKAARSNPLTVAFDPEGDATLRTSGAGVDALLGRVFGEISIAAVAGTWPRLKVCRNDACRWAYYDASRNHSGIWCSMAVCGNRAKGRALRVRRRGSTGV